MKRTEILVTGTGRDLVNSMVKWSDNNNDWVFSLARTGEEAIEKFHQRDFDMVLFTDGKNLDEERKLRKIFSIQNPDIIMLTHYNTETGLPTQEINDTLENQRSAKKTSFSFIDDALKNAGLNINVQ